MSKTENLNVMGHDGQVIMMIMNPKIPIGIDRFMKGKRLPFPSTGFFKSEIYPISGSLTAFHIANMR